MCKVLILVYYLYVISWFTYSLCVCVALRILLANEQACWSNVTQAACLGCAKLALCTAVLQVGRQSVTKREC